MRSPIYIFNVEVLLHGQSSKRNSEVRNHARAFDLNQRQTSGPTVWRGLSSGNIQVAGTILQSSLEIRCRSNGEILAVRVLSLGSRMVCGVLEFLCFVDATLISVSEISGDFLTSLHEITFGQLAVSNLISPEPSMCFWAGVDYPSLWHRYTLLCRGIF